MANANDACEFDMGDDLEITKATLRIHSPDQDPKDFSVNFKMDRPRNRLSLRFQGMPKLEPGELRFELLLNGEHVAWHTVNVSPASRLPESSPPTES
jgi:hypothetical protein